MDEAELITKTLLNTFKNAKSGFDEAEGKSRFHNKMRRKKKKGVQAQIQQRQAANQRSVCGLKIFF